MSGARRSRSRDAGREPSKPLEGQRRVGRDHCRRAGFNSWHLHPCGNDACGDPVCTPARAHTGPLSAAPHRRHDTDGDFSDATHTLEVVIWAGIYKLVGAAPSGTPLVYFAFVNYTTLGYGEILPLPKWQLLGPITAMNGVLLFGWSTAVIFEILRKTIELPPPKAPAAGRRGSQPTGRRSQRS